MNTYQKFAANVFVAKCSEKHSKGEQIEVTTKSGKVNLCIVFNLVAEKGGFYYYSIVRADGYNLQQKAKIRSENYSKWADAAMKKSDEYAHAANERMDFLTLGEPIKVGHHSEKKHRALIARNHNRMNKSVELEQKAKEHLEKSKYWETRENDINLSMPESIDFYKHKLEKVSEYHEGLKSGKYERGHSFELQYALRDKKEAKKNYDLAVKLWGDEQSV